jgi:hypothetical protein
MNSKATYILVMAKTFPKTHPKSGAETQFSEQILAGKKIHTIRKNPDYWMHVANEVNEGRAVLSIREWTGRPYFSKHREIMQLEKIAVEQIKVYVDHQTYIQLEGFINIDYPSKAFARFAANDGMTADDLYSWLHMEKKNHEAALIYFTDFDYNKTKKIS